MLPCEGKPKEITAVRRIFKAKNSEKAIRNGTVPQKSVQKPESLSKKA